MKAEADELIANAKGHEPFLAAQLSLPMQRAKRSATPVIAQDRERSGTEI